MSCTLGLLALVVVGCSASADSSDTAANALASNAGSEASKVLLPPNDPCRDVLAPLAAGLAEGAVGLQYTDAVRVTLTGESEERDYTVFVDGKSFQANGQEFANDYSFDVVLDNDSASMCLFQSAKLQDKLAAVESARLTPASKRESALPAGAKVNVPKSDNCASVVRLLGQSVGVSVAGDKLTRVDVKLDGASDERDYVVHAEGSPFVVNGKPWTPKGDYLFTLDNDSQSLCLPLELKVQEKR